jgi:hypothetical protein
MFQWADAGVTPGVIASFANALRWVTGAKSVDCTAGTLNSHKSYLRWVGRARLRLPGRLSQGVGRPRTLSPRPKSDCSPTNRRSRQAWWPYRNHVYCPRTFDVRRMRPADEHPHGSDGLGHSPLLSVPLNCGRAGTVQERYGRRARDRNGSLARDRRWPQPVVERAGEQAASIKERVREIVYDADAGTARIEMVKPPDGSAGDEVEATDPQAGTESRKSGHRRH